MFRKIFILSLTIFLILGFGLNVKAFTVNNELKIEKDALEQLDEVVVESVIDGDTFKTGKGEDVRLIGVNTPETKHPDKPVEYYGKKASQYTRSIIQGSKVYLEYGVEEKDKYNRTLAYVFLPDGTLFNARLLYEGYANLLTIPPNIKYVDLFKEMVEEARENEKGLWSGNETELSERLPVISWKKADNYYGKKVFVVGEIVDTYDSGKAIFLNFAENYKDTFTAVIFSSDTFKFDFEPEDYFLNKKVKVKGEIKEYSGAPEIIINETSQIKIIDK